MEDEEKKEIEEIEETKEIVKEPVNKPQKNNSKTIIIILSAVIVVLVIILLLVLLGGNKKDNDKKEEENNTEEKEDITDKDIGIDNLKSSNSKLYFNKYIVDFKTGKIINLDGEYIAEKTEDKQLREGVNNSLILIYYDTTNYVTNVQRIIDESVDEYDYEGMASPIVDVKTNRVVGFVDKKSNSHDVLNIFNEKGMDTIDLNNSIIYTFALGEGEDKKVYDGRYIITAASQAESSAHGLYDIKDKKVLIENEYTGIEHLHDDIFVAIKDDYSGVINKNNKVLLDFDYDSISYSNGLYFVAKDTTLDILDSDFKPINAQMEIDSLKSFTYNPCCGSINPYKLIKYKDYVVIGTTDPYENDDYEYTVIDKKGNKTELGKGDVVVVKDYLITSKTDDTKITVYDSNLKEKYVLTANQKGTSLYGATIFLDKVLSLEGKKFFNFPDGKEKSSVSPIRRTSQEYEIKLDFKDGYGTVTVSKDGEVLATLDDVSVHSFLEAENNGITITKTHFIFNAGNSLIILKK